jgi:hypothetical protein
MVLWFARVVDGGFEVLLELFFDTPLGVGKRGVSLDLAAHRAGGAESLDSRPYVPKSRIPSGVLEEGASGCVFQDNVPTAPSLWCRRSWLDRDAKSFGVCGSEGLRI